MASGAGLDLDARVVTVRHQLAFRAGGFELVEPKSHSGRRMLALPELAVAALRSHRRLQVQERLRSGPGWSNDLGLVFTSQTGHPLHRRNVLRWFQGVLRREGLPVRGIKELRHTAASLLHAQGLSPGRSWRCSGTRTCASPSTRTRTSSTRTADGRRSAWTPPWAPELSAITKVTTKVTTSAGSGPPAPIPGLESGRGDRI